MLSRKTYVMIAHVIKDRRDNKSARDSQHSQTYGAEAVENIKQSVLSDFATMLAYQLSGDNPAFNTVRFVEACRKSTEAEIVEREGRS